MTGDERKGERKRRVLCRYGYTHAEARADGGGRGKVI